MVKSKEKLEKNSSKQSKDICAKETRGKSRNKRSTELDLDSVATVSKVMSTNKGNKMDSPLMKTRKLSKGKCSRMEVNSVQENSNAIKCNSNKIVVEKGECSRGLAKTKHEDRAMVNFPETKLLAGQM